MTDPIEGETYWSLSDDVPDDAEYVTIQYHFGDDNGPTVQAGKLVSLSDATRRSVEKRFEKGFGFYESQEEGFHAAYVPGPAWHDGPDFPEGFDAMGEPIPPERLSAALEALRDMAPHLDTDEEMALIGSVADDLERDNPYRSKKHAKSVLDETGAYRLMAALLSAEVDRDE